MTKKGSESESALRKALEAGKPSSEEAKVLARYALVMDELVAKVQQHNRGLQQTAKSMAKLADKMDKLNLPAERIISQSSLDRSFDGRLEKATESTIGQYYKAIENFRTNANDLKASASKLDESAQEITDATTQMMRRSGKP